MTVLATLVLGGLAGAKQRVRIDRTRSTIRKLNEIILPQYESYQRRRVPAVVTGVGAPTTVISPTNTFAAYVDTSTGNYHGPRAPNGSWGLGPFNATTATKPSQVLAQSRLQMLRLLQIRELPDAWGDVLNGASSVMSGSCPPFARTGPVFAYAARRQSVATISTGTNGGAECLYSITSFGGFEPGAMANFRSDEIGDRDRDGAPEFIDAWLNPIEFIRWAPGFSSLYPFQVTASGTSSSPAQIADTVNFHDPLDPQRVDNAGTMGSGARGYGLVPLIVSAGPDQTLGLTRTGSAGWSTLVGPANTNGLSMLTVTGTLVGSGTLGLVTNGTAVRDNITNHDLMKK